jgi:hypothetical protein
VASAARRCSVHWHEASSALRRAGRFSKVAAGGGLPDHGARRFVLVWPGAAGSRRFAERATATNHALSAWHARLLYALLDEFVYYDIVIYMQLVFIVWLALLAGVSSALPGSVLEQREQSFSIRLNGSVPEATPLFGPVREAEWAPTWKPRFIHPTEGGQREGAVFTTTGGDGKERLWLLTAYQPEAGRVEYVLVVPGFTANQIKIRVVPDGEKHCQATITYRHSALGPEGNKEVAKLDAQWAEQQRTHWETAMNAVLAKGGLP